MKLTITKEDLRQAILKQSGLDINNATIDIEIEGYVKAKDYRLKATVPNYDAPVTTVVTDKDMNVISVKHEPTRKVIKEKKKSSRNHYTGRVDYSSYKNEVIDFATSNEDKRKLPTFGLTISTIIFFYKKIQI